MNCQIFNTAPLYAHFDIMDWMQLSRRGVVRLGGIAGLANLAGCLDAVEDEDPDTETPTETPGYGTPTPTTTATATATATATPTATETREPASTSTYGNSEGYSVSPYGSPTDSE